MTILTSLDESLYSPDSEELAFFKAETKITDDDTLRKHIMAVQAEAYKVCPYPCIRSFAFTKLKISRLPAYPDVLELSRHRKDAILLDVGCCFGNDLRKAVSDGWPVENVIGSDLRSSFWNCGHDLFKTTPKTYPAAFMAGNLLDPSVITPRDPFYEMPDTPRPKLLSLTSLTPLQGHVSAIHASSLFHLFDEGDQLQLARQLATLLSPTPGSVIFGSHGAYPVKGYRHEYMPATKTTMFCHSPQSWQELWDGQVFAKGTVRVEVALKEADGVVLNYSLEAPFYWLIWSVTRLSM
ncbi:hypothetical protein APHAL10511_004533 [Amanita phalloides]|nr:hypothetical protein APHAL10511_004533 [Amanita phalloides]